MTESSRNYIDFILAQLKVAAIRARLIATEIDSIDVALRGNFISADGALEWAREVGALDLIAVSSALTLTSSI